MAAAKPLVKQFTDGIKCCNDVRPQVVYLDQLATAAPQFREQVEVAKGMLEYIQGLCQLGTDLAAEMGELGGEG